MVEYIMKNDGNVYLVQEHDLQGRNKTIHFLGKEYIEEKKEEKPKVKRQKKEEK
jgi:hypothetical protein